LRCASDRLIASTESASFVITRLVRVIQLGRPHEAGDDQLKLVQLSARFSVFRAFAYGHRTFVAFRAEGPRAHAFSAMEGISLLDPFALRRR
jgi:hypothetical protein